MVDTDDGENLPSEYHVYQLKLKEIESESMKCIDDLTEYM